MAEPYDICVWCPDHPDIPASQFDEHLDRMHPSISDPRNSTSCWSHGEVCTPDGTLREIDGMDARIDGEWGVGASDPAERESMALLRLLALPFADRPGYREEWRP